MYKLHDNGLIGYENTGETEFSLYGTDSEKVYIDNLKTQPKDWFYRDNRFRYIRNSNGHRSVEVFELPKDFILFAGCSLTEGIGVKLQDSYADKVANHFNLGYYNLALNGAGPDLVSHNLSMWFKNIKLLPKYVVIQWPSPHRVFYKSSNNVYPLGPWSCKPNTVDVISNNAWEAYGSMITTDFFEHYIEIFKSTFKPLLEISNIKVFQFTAEDIEIIDYARDLKHPGIESHNKLAEKVIQYLAN